MRANQGAEVAHNKSLREALCTDFTVAASKTWGDAVSQFEELVKSEAVIEPLKNFSKAASASRGRIWPPNNDRNVLLDQTGGSDARNLSAGSPTSLKAALDDEISRSGRGISSVVTTALFGRHKITRKKDRARGRAGSPRHREAPRSLVRGPAGSRSRPLRVHQRNSASTNMARRYGWAPNGERLRVGVPHGHWKTTTFVAGLSLSGMVAPMVLDGPINGAAFQGYVWHVLFPNLRLATSSSWTISPATRAPPFAAPSSTAFGPPSARCSQPSPQPNAQTTSPPLDATQRERIPL